MEFLSAFIKNGYKMPGAGDTTKDLPQEVKDRLARADQIERDSKSTQAAFNQREDKIVDQTDKAISPLIKDFLDKTALSNELCTVVHGIRPTSEAILRVALGAIDNPNSTRLTLDLRRYELASESNFLASSNCPWCSRSLPSSRRYRP